MYLSPINYQSNAMYSKVNQNNQNTSIKNTDITAFKGANIRLKTTNTNRNIIASCLAGITTMVTAIKVYCSCDKDFNQAWQERLKAMAECDGFGRAPQLKVECDKPILKKAYIKNPELVKQLMTSTLKDMDVIWTEYSADAIDLIVENNKEHPEKTELLKKCLSRSYEFDNGDIYRAKEIVNTHSDEMIQKALIEAGYQENKVWNYPETFYSPYLFTKQFE